jgi:hypothetical protein
MKRLLLILVVVLSVLTCSENPEMFIPHLEGYWEIKQVKKEGKVVKTYTISTTVDYFKVNDDLTGFRKKVTPSLDGKFTVTDDESPFVLKVENNKLYIYYTVNNITFKESIEHATEEELVITNDEGFKYIYKPFESLNLE